MTARSKYCEGSAILFEMQEFAGFPKATQRYIRRALDVGLRRRDALRRWARTPTEEASVRAHYRAYRGLETLRGRLPDDAAPESSAPVLESLFALAAFDLAQGRLPGFGPFRFLYERLLGAAARPFLPAAFCAAAALPHLHPDDRRALLATAVDTVAVVGWSNREPVFLPEWVEKVDTRLTA